MALAAPCQSQVPENELLEVNGRFDTSINRKESSK